MELRHPVIKGTVVSSELEDPINTVPSVGEVGPC